MTTSAQWIAGGRPRTLPAAIAPVLVGTGSAAADDGFRWWAALLALVVALALQIGVNYANDYSDGVRGTDADRVGPFRLVGSGAADPPSVKRAALGCFAVAAVVGLLLVVTTGAWWGLLIGVAALPAAWYYTGGSTPYGYRGLGEVSVFVFFGLAAVIGTHYVQAGGVTPAAVLGGAASGALACAILVTNNLRDIPTDRLAGKRTLAVALDDTRTRTLYVTLVAAAPLLAVVIAAVTSWWALLALLATPLAVAPVRTVLAGARGRDLVPALAGTGQVQLAYGLLLGLGLALG